MRITTAVLLLAAAVSALAHSTTTALDPAALIPVVAFASADSSSTLDPTLWSPEAETAQPDSIACLQANGSHLLLVHDLHQRFCVLGEPLCSDQNRQGLCPYAQQGLPNGAQCAALPNSSSSQEVLYGCLSEEVVVAHPISCHLRSSKT